MELQNNHPIRNTVIWWVYIILLTLAVCMMWQGCGTRKLNKEKEITTIKTENNQESIVSVNKDLESKASNEAVDQNNNTKENTSTKTTKEYNTDGSIKKETQETKIGKSTDKSSKSRKSLTEVKNRVDSNFINKVYQTQYIGTLKKSKDVDSNTSIVKNVGGWGMIVFIVVILVAAALFYWWPKRPKGDIRYF